MAARANNVFWLVETLKIFLSETTQPMELLHYRNDDWVVLCQVFYFFADRISKMAATGQLSLLLDPVGISLKNFFVRNYSTNWIFCIIWMFLGWFYTWSIILVQIGNPTWLPGPIMCSNWLKLKIFLSETTQPMALLHYRNDDWVVLCQLCKFCADRISKMATTGQLSLPLDPMGISLKNLFVRNYSTNWIFCNIWMFLGWFCTWSIILVQIGNPTWLPGPIMCSDWLKLWRSSCQKLLSPWNCNIIEMMTGWSSTKFVIFVPIGNPRWPPQGDLV
jgi:hypothetical protein